jgi:hypothetical protein
MSDRLQLSFAERLRPCRWETVSGDVTVCVPCGDDLFLAIVDVLGHGQEAHTLALAIRRFLRDHYCADVAGLAGRLHAQLRGTRGAAAGLGYLNSASGSLSYVGIGNTGLRKFGAACQALPSQPGTFGQQIRTPQAQTLQLAPGDLLVLTTDGISERIAAEQDMALLTADVHAVAEAVIRRYGKEHDDASCIVVRYGDA